MQRSLSILLLLAVATLPAYGQGAEEQEFYAYLGDVKLRWPEETISERRKSLVREFQRYDYPDAAKWLMTRVLVKDRAGDVLRETVRVLASYRRPETVAQMAKTWKSKLKKGERRALGVYAFVHTKDPAARKVIETALKDRDARTIVAACDAIGLGNRRELVPQLVKMLKHRSEKVRIASLQALYQLREEDVVPEVFKAFCAADNPRVRFEAWQTLERLTRQEHGLDPNTWQDWWMEQKGEVAEGAPDPWGKNFPNVRPPIVQPARFFGIPVVGQRICFVLDTSGDMDNAWRIDVNAERKKPKEERTPSFFTVKTRWQLVSAHVGRCLKELPPETEVAFVFYYNRVFVYPDSGKFMRNSEKNRKALLAHLKKVKRDGTTAMYEGLKRGWGFLKDGDAALNFKRGCDTILFTTDGRVTAGKLKDRADRLRDEIWRVASLRRLRIHTVGLHNHDFELMKNIAKDTGGLYVHAQQAGDAAEPQDLDFWPEKKAAFEAARKAARKGAGG